MRWEPAQIARFARGAGFHGDDERTAVAIAIATSGGVAHYDVQAGVPGAGHWKGLWGIDTDRWPEWGDADLYVPQINAEVAHVLYERTGGFAWSPAYRARTHETHDHLAGVERTKVQHAQSATLPFTFHTTGQHVHDTGARLRRAHANRTHFRPPGR